MEKILNEIKLHYSDPDINTILKRTGDFETNYTLHYNHNEDFFITLPEEFIVPHFPVHHDIRKNQPSEEYLLLLRRFFNKIIPLAPQVFRNLTYFFDPSEIHKPCFFQIYKTGDSHYLYLVRIDLSYKTHEDTVLHQGTNDVTPKYQTNHLFLESNLIPLEKVNFQNNRIFSFTVKQIISQTWIGETGRGHFAAGIWMDYELTKFLSKLFIPNGKRTYPYYPFTCKYKTICYSVLDFAPEGRKKHLPYLNKAIQFIIPKLPYIQKSLKNNKFSEDLEIFRKIKDTVPSSCKDTWNSIKIHSYLNDKNMKEFLVEF